MASFIHHRVIPELDYPDDSAGENSVENNGEFRFTVMAGLDPYALT
jgi:hypothetical protein